MINLPRLLILFLALGSFLPAKERPNFLWLVSEDNGPFLGAYGDPYAITPNLDRLAEQGVIYNHAFATSPVCAPARFTLATGVYVNRAGTEHMRSKNPIPSHIRFLSSYMREAGYYCTNNRKEDYNVQAKPDDAWDESSNTATYRNRAPGQPFFHIYNVTTSHESSLHRGVEPEFHDPADAPVPPYHPDLPEVRETWAVYYSAITRMDAEMGEFLEQLEADGLAEDTIVFYYSDHGGAVARSKRFLFESGMRVPLSVYFPDNWKHLAPALPGSALDRLVTFVDIPPTLLSLAGVPIPGHMQGQAFLGAFEEEPRAYAFGLRGRMDEKADRARTVRDQRFRYIRNWMPYRPWGQFIEYLWRAPATEAWHQAWLAGETNAVQSRYFSAPKAAEELYDCIADPHNIRNLADDPLYRSTLERMRGALDEWVVYNRDSGLLPEAEMLARSKARNETIYEMVESRDYPVADLLQAANQASDRSTALEEILNLTTHSESGVRFWATSAFLHRSESNEAILSALKNRLNDPSPSVALNAAEALYQRGHDGKDIADAYRSGLQSEHVMVRVHAANSLLNTEPEFARQFLDVIDKQLGDNPTRDYDHRAFEYFKRVFGASS